MNLLDLMIKIGVDDDASEKIGGLTASTIAKATALGNAMYDATKFVAGKAVDMGKSLVQGALDGYGAYEQLAGGVEKIFDQANIDGIMKDAKNAYYDLNMSANQYLESINQVGATFAQTMGDQKGYDTARTGMKAIADYASGTGRNLEELNEKYTLITRAAGSYQSIADQFSGILPATSKGFLEQAKAAGYLSDQYENLTDVPIAEYQDAVTKMLSKGVEDMGLLGNTAAESVQTITGSLAMARSSWDNFITAIGSGDKGMIESSVSGLMDSVFGIVEEETGKREGGLITNVLPVVSNVGSAIVGVIPSVASEIARNFIDTINSTFGTSFDGDAIVSKFEDIGAKVAGILADFGGGFGSSFDADTVTGALEKLGEVAGSVFDFLAQNADEIGYAFGIAADVLGTVADAVLTVMDAMGPLVPIIAGAVAGFMAIQPVIAIFTAIGGAITFFTTVIVPALGMVQSFGGAIALLTTLLGGPITVIAAVVGAIVAFIATNEDARNAVIDVWNAIKSGIGNAINGAKTTITNAMSSMYNAIVSKWNSALAFIKGIPAKIKGALGNLGSLLFSAGSSIIGGLLNGLKSKFEEVKGWVSGVAGTIKSLKGPLPYDRTVLVENGEALMYSLYNGLSRAFEGRVLPYVKTMAGTISESIGTPTMTVTASARQKAAPVLNLTIERMTVSDRDDAEYYARRTSEIWAAAIRGSL